MVKYIKADNQIFPNSKVRDSSGNLLVCYHHMPEDYDHLVDGKFGIWFVSQEDWNEGRYFGDFVQKFYLNITHPFIFDAGSQGYGFIQIWDKYEGNAEMNSAMQKDEGYVSDWVEVSDDEWEPYTETDLISLYAKEHGYDGCIIKNVVETPGGDSVVDDYIIFNISQAYRIK